MILKTQIRPDRFHRVLSGKKKEHRIPVQHIELFDEKYNFIDLYTSFTRSALVEVLSIREDKQKQEYVVALGEIRSTKNVKQKNKINNNYQEPVKEKSKKEQVQMCEILRDGHKVGVLDLSTKKGRKQRYQLEQLQGYTFNYLS